MASTSRDTHEPAPENLIREVPCDTALEFVREISPIARGFLTELLRTWLFRGHSDDVKYRLVPTALRPSEAKRLLKLSALSRKIDGIESYRHLELVQILMELELVLRFISAADDAGLTIPEYGQEMSGAFQYTLKQCVSNINNIIATGRLLDFPIWPEPSFSSVIALARHHGVPTRYMDWTFSSKCAAYFAAAGAARISNECSNEGRRLSVWALRMSAVSKTRIRDDDFWGLHVVTAPNATNPNLFAQRGCFLVNHVQVSDAEQRIDAASIDEIIKRRAAYIAPSDLPCMMHFTLPVEEAGELLWYLAKDGISGNTVFPNYDGAMKRIEEEQYYEPIRDNHGEWAWK